MSDLLRDSYGPWPSDSEPPATVEVDPETLRAAAKRGYPDPGDVIRCGTSPFAGIPPAGQPKTRPFTITIADGGTTVRVTAEAVSLAEALEKATAAIRR